MARKRARALAVALALLCLPGVAAPAVAAPDAPVSVALEGATLVARDQGGGVLAPEARAGMTFSAGDPATGRCRFRIDRVVPAPDAPGAPILYDVSVQSPAADGASCAPGRAGSRSPAPRALG